MPARRRKKFRKRPAPRPKTEEEQEDAAASDEHEADVYQIAHDSQEVLSVWTVLDMDEKVEVLDITVPELAETAKLSARGAASVLDNAELMGALRVVFVIGCNNNGVVPALSTDPVIRSMFIIMENHLRKAYVRKNYQTKAPYLLAVTVWTFLDIHWFFRLVLVGLCAGFLVWFRKAEWLRVAFEFLVLPFEDEPDRMAARLDYFLVTMLAIYLGDWLDWYTLLLIFMGVPAVLLELERRLPVDDQAAFGKLRSALQFACTCLCLYLCWYSWWVFFVATWLFMPTISRYATALSCLGTTYVFTFAQKLHFLAPKSSVASLAVFVACLGCTIYNFFWGSWFWFTFFVFGCLACLPASWTAFASNSINLIGGLMLTLPMDIFRLIGYAQIVLILGFALVKVLVWDRCCGRGAQQHTDATSDDSDEEYYASRQRQRARFNPD